MMNRFFGLDVHKNFIMAAAVDADQNVILQPQKIASTDFEDWSNKYLTPMDEVVIEAMSGAWVIYDFLVDKVGRVVVTHPYHIKMIAASFVKTDKRDAVALARLLAAKMIPEVWVPPVHVREMRSLIHHRTNLIRRRASAKNRLRGIFKKYRIISPKGMTVFKPSLPPESCST